MDECKEPKSTARSRRLHATNDDGKLSNWDLEIVLAIVLPKLDGKALKAIYLGPIDILNKEASIGGLGNGSYEGLQITPWSSDYVLKFGSS